MDFSNEIMNLSFLIPFTSQYKYDFCLLLLLLTIIDKSENHGIYVCINELNKLDENTTEHDHIAPWEVTKWLVFSSFLMSLPAFYGMYYGIYGLSTLIIITTIVSGNHWRIAMHNSWRRNVDLILAKITCTVLFIYNTIYIRDKVHKMIFYVLCITGIYFFYLSNTLYKPNTIMWRNFHFTFHFLCMWTEFLLMYNIINS